MKLPNTFLISIVCCLAIAAPVRAQGLSAGIYTEEDISPKSKPLTPPPTDDVLLATPSVPLDKMKCNSKAKGNAGARCRIWQKATLNKAYSLWLMKNGGDNRWLRLPTMEEVLEEDKNRDLRADAFDPNEICDPKQTEYGCSLTERVAMERFTRRIASPEFKRLYRLRNGIADPAQVDLSGSLSTGLSGGLYTEYESKRPDIPTDGKPLTPPPTTAVLLATPGVPLDKGKCDPRAEGNAGASCRIWQRATLHKAYSLWLIKNGGDNKWLRLPTMEEVLAADKDRDPDRDAFNPNRICDPQQTRYHCSLTEDVAMEKFTRRIPYASPEFKRLYRLRFGKEWYVWDGLTAENNRAQIAKSKKDEQEGIEINRRREIEKASRQDDIDRRNQRIREANMVRETWRQIDRDRGLRVD
jgi:hypothetical protein